MDNVLRAEVETCCRTAKDFTKLYYQTCAKRRHVSSAIAKYKKRSFRLQMSRLYLGNGLFVWNGNGAHGKDNIQKYFIELPTSEHIISTVDAQPLIDEAVSGQITYLIQTGATVDPKLRITYDDKVPPELAIRPPWPLVIDLRPAFFVSKEQLHSHSNWKSTIRSESESEHNLKETTAVGVETIKYETEDMTIEVVADALEANVEVITVPKNSAATPRKTTGCAGNCFKTEKSAKKLGFE
uniref:Nuclear transport factor 2 domain-containing protein n=1 Tax=Glossina palpalis gambiensis TaxID=67801 RepID=A0A1B0AN26_9MUSC